MTIETQTFSMKPTAFEGVLYDPALAQELRAEGWVDDLDMGLGRNNEGPLLRGHVRQGTKATVVFPGDFVLKRTTDKGQEIRAVYSPAVLANLFDYDPPEGVTPDENVTVVGSSDTPDTAQPDWSSPPAFLESAPPSVPDPSGADVQNIDQEGDWVSRDTTVLAEGADVPANFAEPPEDREVAEDNITSPNPKPAAGPVGPTESTDSAQVQPNAGQNAEGVPAEPAPIPPSDPAGAEQPTIPVADALKTLPTHPKAPNESTDPSPTAQQPDEAAPETVEEPPEAPQEPVAPAVEPTPEVESAE